MPSLIVSLYRCKDILVADSRESKLLLPHLSRSEASEEWLSIEHVRGHEVVEVWL